MKQPPPPESLSPLETAAQSQRRRLSWPSTLVWIAALGTTVAGTTLFVRLVADRPVHEATIAGLFLRLDRVTWLDDQMDHPVRYPMPDSMMPGMPPHGVFRLNAELILHNPSPQTQRFHISEVFFRSSKKGMWPASGGELVEVHIEPGRRLNLFTYFDVADSDIEGDLRRLWIREGETVQMLAVPHPPDHFHDEEDQEREEVEWPGSVTALSDGNPQEGERLYMSTYHCNACHGHPDIPDTNNVGPHLGGVAPAAARRVPAKSAAQYLYEAILDPNAYIVAQCKNHPCEDPSSMPPFGELLGTQDMADLIAYLLAQNQ